MLCAFLPTVPAFAKEKVTKFTFAYAGKSRTYYSVVPDREGPLPVVVLLHGSGRNGWVMADAWKDLALREGFIITAPDAYDSSAWTFKMDPPGFLHAVVEQVKVRHAIDENRIYLFGHSAGAGHALILAIMDSDYFAAIAVHSGALQLENYKLFAYAKRRLPVAIWVGNRDLIFPVDTVTATKQIFESHGFHLELSIIPNHNHDYYAISDEVNDSAWDFLKKTQLEQLGVADQH
jgi:predicted esterase